MESDVRDLLDGYLRDLLTAYDGLKKAIHNHKYELGVHLAHELGDGLSCVEDGIGLLACEECWSADRKPYPMGIYSGRSISTFRLCESCRDKINAKRDPFGGVTTSRSDE